MPFQVQRDGFASEVSTPVLDPEPFGEPVADPVVEPVSDPVVEPVEDRCACGRPWDQCVSRRGPERDWVWGSRR